MVGGKSPTGVRRLLRIPFWLGTSLFLAIVVLLLWKEHEAHILGALPWVLLALCPVIHLAMHRRHGGHSHGSGGHDERATHRHGGGGAS